MQSFIKSELYKIEDAYDYITDKFHDMKADGKMEDWCEIHDIVVLTDGDVYAVQYYFDSSFECEGHGKHTLMQSEPDMMNAVLVATQDEILAIINNEMLYTR